jgi:hypothetical protein
MPLPPPKKTIGKSVIFFVIGQTVIILIAVGVLYWWQVYITDVLIDKNVKTIQSLNKQLVNFERQIYLLKQENQAK